MDRRRFLVTSLAGALAAPLAAEAQQPPEHPTKVYRIGYLTGNTASASERVLDALRQGLRELGHLEGRNLQIHYGFGEGSPQRLAELAADVVRLNVDLIVASAAGVAAARKATSSIPIAW